MGWETERELLRICCKIGRGRWRWRQPFSGSGTQAWAHPRPGRMMIRRRLRRCLLLSRILFRDVFSDVAFRFVRTNTTTFSRQLRHIWARRRCCPRRLFSRWRVGQSLNLDGGDIHVERSVTAGTAIVVICCPATLKFSHFLEDVLDDRPVIDGRIPLLRRRHCS